MLLLVYWGPWGTSTCLQWYNGCYFWHQPVQSFQWSGLLGEPFNAFVFLVNPWLDWPLIPPLVTEASWELGWKRKKEMKETGSGFVGWWGTGIIVWAGEELWNYDCLVFEMNVTSHWVLYFQAGKSEYLQDHYLIGLSAVKIDNFIHQYSGSQTFFAPEPSF